MILNGDLSISVVLDGDMSAGAVLDGDLGVFQKVVEAPPYTGPLTATPGAQPQTFETAGLMLPGDFVVEAVPNNYGLITWNGSTITVS